MAWFCCSFVICVPNLNKSSNKSVTYAFLDGQKPAKKQASAMKALFVGSLIMICIVAVTRFTQIQEKAVFSSWRARGAYDIYRMFSHSAKWEAIALRRVFRNWIESFYERTEVVEPTPLSVYFTRLLIFDTAPAVDFFSAFVQETVKVYYVYSMWLTRSRRCHCILTRADTSRRVDM